MHLEYMVKPGKDKAISVRLSPRMLEELDARAILEEKDRTQVIREAIAKHLNQSISEPLQEELSDDLQGNYHSMGVPIKIDEDSRDSRLDLIEQKQDELYTLVNDLYDLFHRQEERNGNMIKLVNELASVLNERSQENGRTRRRDFGSH